MSRAITLSFLLLVAATAAPAGVEIVLQDGRVLKGATLELKDDNYLFELDGGQGTLALPAGLVREIRFFDAPEPDAFDAATGEPVEPPVDELDRTPRNLVVDPADPAPDTRRPDPRTPPPAEQVRAFGRPPATFRPGAVDTVWRNEDVLGRNTDATQFNPSRWYRPARSSEWSPTSAFDDRSAYPSFNPSRWYRPRTRSTWFPRDAFAPTEWFPPVVSSRD